MNEFMKKAFSEAQVSYRQGGIPIGAVLVRDNEVIGVGHNTRVQSQDTIGHAEMNAIANAGRMCPNEYSECTLYTTLAPCSMCAGAIRLFGIGKVVYGDNKNYSGDCECLEGLAIDVKYRPFESAELLLKAFINENPFDWAEDIGEAYESEINSEVIE